MASSHREIFSVIFFVSVRPSPPPLALRPSQMALGPSQLAPGPGPSQLALGSSQLALRPSLLAPRLTQLDPRQSQHCSFLTGSLSSFSLSLLLTHSLTLWAETFLSAGAKNYWSTLPACSEVKQKQKNGESLPMWSCHRSSSPTGPLLPYYSMIFRCVLASL